MILVSYNIHHRTALAAFTLYVKGVGSFEIHGVEFEEDLTHCSNCLESKRVRVDGVPALVRFASTDPETGENNGQATTAILSFAHKSRLVQFALGFDSYSKKNQEIFAELVRSIRL